MSKQFAFAYPVRTRVVLCCAAAVLLSACGGTADDTDSQQTLAATMTNDVAAGPAHAGASAGAAAQPAPATAAEMLAAPTPAPGAPVLTSADTTVVSNTQPAASESSAGPASAEFNLNGYQGSATTAQPGSSSTDQAADSANTLMSAPTPPTY